MIFFVGLLTAFCGAFIVFSPVCGLIVVVYGS